MKVLSWVEWVCYVIVLASVAVVVKINWDDRTLVWWIITFTILLFVTILSTSWKCRVSYLEGFQDGEEWREKNVGLRGKK